MPRLLKDLQINDVSSVDRGAGEGVKIMLMKRDDTNADESPSDNQTLQIDMTGLLRKALNAETDAMTAEQIKKQIDDAVNAAMKATGEQIAKLSQDSDALKAENAFLKLSPKHQEFAKDFSAEDKKKFADKTDADRDADCEKAAKAAESKLDPEIRKRLDQADEDRKVLNKLLEKDEISTFAKRATELGLAEDKGEMLRKAHRGDAEALKQVEELLKQMGSALRETQKSGRIFTEFGTAVEKGGSKAIDALNAKAAELRKADKKLSPQQAFAKVCEDPDNSDLVKQEKSERYNSMGAVVA